MKSKWWIEMKGGIRIVDFDLEDEFYIRQQIDYEYYRSNSKKYSVFIMETCSY